MQTKLDASFGVVPFYKNGEGVRYLLVKHRKGHWGFPKGHAEMGESERESALRELAEETGITEVELGDEVFEEYYEFISKKGKLVKKTVKYYLGEVHEKYIDHIAIQEAELMDARWGNANETRERLTFDEGRELFAKVEASANQK